MPNLTIPNTAIEYRLRRSPRAKRISITVANGKVVVTVPPKASLAQAKTFVEQKVEWIFKHIAAFEQRVISPAKEFVAGEKFLYRGHPFTLQIKTAAIKKPAARFLADTAWVYMPAAIPEDEWPHQVKEALVQWYKSQARAVFSDKLSYYAQILNVTWQDLRIKEQKTRWGSCSKRGNINLNWRAILAPDPVIDYLILHELAHVRHMNHSKDFWNLIARYMPDYERWKKWLREKGRELWF